MRGSIFSKANIVLLGITFLIMFVGYLLLGQGPVTNHISWSIAPVILILVYCVLFPLSIVYRSKDENDSVKGKGV
jgi:uncharacterized membrane protein YozB (DUF420 family)